MTTPNTRIPATVGRSLGVAELRPYVGAWRTAKKWKGRYDKWKSRYNKLKEHYEELKNLLDKEKRWETVFDLICKYLPDLIDHALELEGLLSFQFFFKFYKEYLQILREVISVASARGLVDEVGKKIDNGLLDLARHRREMVIAKKATATWQATANSREELMQNQRALLQQIDAARFEALGLCFNGTDDDRRRADDRQYTAVKVAWPDNETKANEFNEFHHIGPRQVYRFQCYSNGQRTWLVSYWLDHDLLLICSAEVPAKAMQTEEGRRQYEDALTVPASILLPTMRRPPAAITGLASWQRTMYVYP
jgi:hypothetical protein